MINMTKTLVRIIFLAAVVGGGILYTQQKEDLKNSEPVAEVEKKREQFQGSVKGLADNISDQTQELAARGQEVGEHVNNVLGAYIKPSQESSRPNNSSTSSSSSNENSDLKSTAANTSSDNTPKPIYEETLEYGRYLYCQQVVKDYEARR